MSKIAAHCRRAADDRVVHRRQRPLPALAGALLLATGLPLIASEAAAQSRSGIVINNDVLNSLGSGPEAAPWQPLAPAEPAMPPSRRGQPGVQAPLAPPSGGGSAGAGFQAYGDGGHVVTRPGTLLFPPPQAPDSTLTPGFAGNVDNEAARARALDNAFAEGPEPSSQLLIPLDGPPAINLGESNGGGNDSIVVFMDNLPAADPDADRSAAPVLVLQAPPPQPARPKPAVPPTALAAVEPPTIVETMALAPEFTAPDRAEPEAAPEAAESQAAEPEAIEPEAEADVDQTPPPTLVEAPATTTPDSDPTAVAVAETTPTQDFAAPDTGDAPVSLLPETRSRPEPPAPARAESPIPAEPQPSGLQTASLTFDAIEDRSFLFEVDSAELSPDVELELRALAEALHGDHAGDIQVLGFASGQDATNDEARKLALSRALKVRSFLINAGIASTRIQVRSLGDRADGGPANRVDIKPIGS